MLCLTSCSPPFLDLFCQAHPSPFISLALAVGDPRLLKCPEPLCPSHEVRTIPHTSVRICWLITEVPYHDAWRAISAQKLWGVFLCSLTKQGCFFNQWNIVPRCYLSHIHSLFSHSIFTGNLHMPGTFLGSGAAGGSHTDGACHSTGGLGPHQVGARPSSFLWMSLPPVSSQPAERHFISLFPFTLISGAFLQSSWLMAVYDLEEKNLEKQTKCLKIHKGLQKYPMVFENYQNS